MSSIDAKKHLFDLASKVLLPGLKKLENEYPHGLVPVMEVLIERIARDVRAALIPERLSWRNVLDVQGRGRLVPDDLNVACDRAWQLGYPFVAWNGLVYPVLKGHHEYAQPVPTLADVGLEEPAASEENCTHKTPTDLTPQGLRWCSECGATRWPHAAWDLPKRAGKKP